ncbi:VOC family protein [Mucilaginibacter galii]|uniref:Glyoxalase n=1 Tax=Mucilaginibacter galii TaxID=2005073 RepID=A0A917J774_9SPHI|nr:VOC family protein [Mucilaginibacter galii]GGI49944.1 glyoxalase [Mucilaginibacter galii]
MISFKRIDHIHICVPAERLEEARHFYKEVMGLNEIHRPLELGDDGIWFTAANIELHVGVEEPLPGTIRHTAFEVVDLEAARQHLINNGVIIQKQRVLPGRSRFSFTDPFGNRMELLQRD